MGKLPLRENKLDPTTHQNHWFDFLIQKLSLNHSEKGSRRIIEKGSMNFLNRLHLDKTKGAVEVRLAQP